MKFVKDLDETFRLLAQCCGGSVYTSIGTDAEGVEIAVPMFTVGKSQDEDGKMHGKREERARRKLHER